ncbi:MAG: aldo/keto reductase [Oscillospiraceae bacterium]|nr:aldo/keto reductase [Oscillospiraceae bacterium]
MSENENVSENENESESDFMMNYRENKKNGDMLSVLGFGCMRYPSTRTGIDLDATERLLTGAVDRGINYFDSAYVYHGGKSETILGDVIAKHKLREKVKLATKLPLFLTRKKEDFDRIFSTQLKRLKTDRIDYYLLHMLTGTDSFDRLRAIGVEEWFAAKKDAGVIGNAGFSYHGGKDGFVKLIDSYDWDFCQIQYNYYDENNQAGKSGLEYAASKDVPVVVMEPLRGGGLVDKLPHEAKQIFREADPNRSLADWGLSWVWNHPEVNVALSGMNTMEQIEENVKTASWVVASHASASLASTADAKSGASAPTEAHETADGAPDSVEGASAPTEAHYAVSGVSDSAGGAGFLSNSELELFDRVKQAMRGSVKIACTGCSYCMPCPSGVDIPVCFSYYNDISINGKTSARFGYFQNSGFISKKPACASLCTQCGKCEKLCPQGIPIRERMKEVEKSFEPLFVKFIGSVARRFVRM